MELTYGKIMVSMAMGRMDTMPEDTLSKVFHFADHYPNFPDVTMTLDNDDKRTVILYSEYDTHNERVLCMLPSKIVSCVVLVDILGTVLDGIWHAETEHEIDNDKE